jgi:membrane protease YdiL (CAAX protease family)
MTDQNAAKSRDIPPYYTESVPPSVRWGVAEVGLAIGALVLSIATGSVIALAASADPDAAGFVVGLVGYALVVLVIVFASFRKGQRSLVRDFRLAFRPIDLVIGLAVGIGMRIVSTLVVLLAVWLSGETPSTGNLRLSDSPVWLVLNGVLITVIIAPFVEELLFRGLVLQSIRNIVLRWRLREQPAEAAQQRRAVWVSVLVSSLVFGALHLVQVTDATLGVAIGFTTVALGVVNALVVYRTNRLGAAIVAHVVFNGSAVLLGLLGS